MELDLDQVMSDRRLKLFAQELLRMGEQIGFKVSARGWCYLMEQARIIDKSGFDKVESWVNACRRRGYIPVDFVAEESARAFSGVEQPTTTSVKGLLKNLCGAVAEGHDYYTPDWWDGEDVYVQMLVEKIDLVTLFRPVTEEYHIPIANSKGWSSILQRAEYARRFREAEERGLRCVLLYCGDHDPDGLRISDTIMKNLEQVSGIVWSDGEAGYDPSALEIVRFGLNYDFITRNGYTWIDNLITGSKLNLADPGHKNHFLPYVQQYLRNYGPRKCEANAIVTTPDAARELVREAIEDIVGYTALERFEEKRRLVRERYEELLQTTGLSAALDNVVNSEDEDDE